MKTTTLAEVASALASRDGITTAQAVEILAEDNGIYIGRDESAERIRVWEHDDGSLERAPDTDDSLHVRIGYQSFRLIASVVYFTR
jgi:hypothetical protein